MPVSVVTSKVERKARKAFQFLKQILFGLGPCAGFAFRIDFQADFVGAAADGAVFDELLAFALAGVDGDDDFLAAGVADVGGFVLHTCRLLPIPARDPQDVGFAAVVTLLGEDEEEV